MKERILLLRKELKMSQAAFAEKINVSRNFIGLVECGDRNFSERTIDDICQIFNVRKEWLKTGKGEMWIERTRSQVITDFAGNLIKEPDDSFKRRLIEVLAQLDENDWEKLESIALKLTTKKD